MAQLLLVEDDAEIRRALIRALIDLGRTDKTVDVHLRGVGVRLTAPPS